MENMKAGCGRVRKNGIRGWAAMSVDLSSFATFDTGLLYHPIKFFELLVVSFSSSYFLVFTVCLQLPL